MAVATNERDPKGANQFLREALAELRRVVWPSREETQRLTLAVVGISLAIGSFLALWDWLFTQIISRIR